MYTETETFSNSQDSQRNLKGTKKAPCGTTNPEGTVDLETIDIARMV